MSGSTISVSNVNPATGSSTGTAIGTATTNSSGAYSIMIAPPPTGPVRIAVAGGSYQSEEDSTTIAAPAPITVLLGSMTQGVVSVDINPLTYFIDLQATADIQHNGTPLATALTNATSNIQGIYGLGTNPNALTPDYTTAGIGTDAGNLGLVLGGIINEDQLLCPTGPGTLVTALASDLTDGVYDGKAFGGPITYCNATMPAIAGTSDFQDALSANSQLQLTPRAFVFGGTGNSLTNNGIMPSQLVGSLSEINSGIASGAPTVTNTFAAGPNMGSATSEDRQGATGTLLTNGSVLIAGGDSTSTGLRNDGVLYNPTSNTFSAVLNVMVLPREFATATLLPNGQVLIAGGLSTSIVTSTTELYDPTTNQFTTGPAMNFAREHAVAVLLSNGSVLIAGGDIGTNSSATATSEIYDPVANTFAATTPSMNSARTSLMAATLPSSDVLIAGGDSSGSSFDTAELYHVGTNNFSIVSSTMNGAREQGTATLLPNGSVLISGGFLVVSNLALAEKTTELYSTASGTFQPSSGTVDMNGARANMTATLLPNGFVLIAGGDTTPGGSSLSTTEYYNSVDNTFAATQPSMTVGRALATATLMQNGQVIIAGGLANGSTVNSTDLYTP